MPQQSSNKRDVTIGTELGTRDSSLDRPLSLILTHQDSDSLGYRGVVLLGVLGCQPEVLAEPALGPLG